MTKVQSANFTPEMVALMNSALDTAVSGDMWGPVSASKNSVPGARVRAALATVIRRFAPR